MSLKKSVKKMFPDLLAKKLGENYRRLKAYRYRKNLNVLAQIRQSDKEGLHFYTQHYQNHFKEFRRKEITLLEIGIGGNRIPKYGGASLRMWKDYFRKGRINGIDIYDKSPHEEYRIKTFKGCQTDEDFLKKVIGTIGAPDIIIDDGSHQNSHVLKSFNILFPYLKEGGIYVIEDLQTSYWPAFGGSSKDLNKVGTSMNYLKSLADGINHKEFILEDFRSSYTDDWISGIHFYHNICFIEKNKNEEPSNYLINNKEPGSIKL